MARKMSPSVTICKLDLRHHKGHDAPPQFLCLGNMRDEDLDPTYMHRIGKRIAAVREAYNLTQVAFAATIGVARNTLANWEAGHKKAPVEPMVRLMREYRVGLNWIYASVHYDLPRGPIGDKILRYAMDHAAMEAADVAPIGVPGMPPSIGQTLPPAAGLHKDSAPPIVEKP